MSHSTFEEPLVDNHYDEENDGFGFDYSRLYSQIKRGCMKIFIVDFIN